MRSRHVQNHCTFLKENLHDQTYSFQILHYLFKAIVEWIKNELQCNERCFGRGS